MKCKCKKCDYSWISTVTKPKACPKCKRYDWDEEKHDMKVKCYNCGKSIDTESYNGYCQHEYNDGRIEYYCHACDNEICNGR